MSIFFTFIETSEYVIDFTKATLSVPELPTSRSFNIQSKLSISVWIKLPPPTSGYDPHLFTFPRSEDADHNLIQMYFYDRNTYFVCNGKTVAFYDSRPKTEDWQHVVLTLEKKDGNINARLFSNGKFVKEKAINTPRLVKSGSNPQQGFVLGNDVDGSSIDDIEQSFHGQITKFNIYNYVLTDEDIKACYEHREPVDGRIIWWEEFQGIPTSNDDVQETGYPEQFYYL